MKLWRQGLACLLCLALLVASTPAAFAVPSGDLDIPAEDIFAEEIPEGLLYVISGTSVSVTGYTGVQDTLEIPATIEGLPVTSLAENAFRDTALRSITIPNAVSRIGAAALAAPALESITVDPDNSFYCVDDSGILYNKTMTRLIRMPGTYSGKLFLPESVAAILAGAFAGCNVLEAVFSKNEVQVDPQDDLLDIPLHFGIDIREDGCIYCPHCDSWFTAAGEPGFAHYTVVFQDWDGTQLSSTVYHAGDAVAIPQEPVREADSTYRYAFAGWDKEVTACTADTVYRATYEVAGLTGDFNADGAVSDRDAIYLLRAIMYPDRFQMNQDGDMNDDGQTIDTDAAYLLRFVLFPNRYPLHPTKA